MKVVIHLLFAALMIRSSAGAAGEATNDPSPAGDYPAAFFDRYHPNTALDMVKQLPGFRPDDGNGARGYSGSAGNILIDGHRPASKQDAPTDVLDRIPAGRVERIELIRGPVRNIELLGETEVVNVVLLADLPATVHWELVTGGNTRTDTLPLEAAMSLADLWHGVNVNTGLEVQRAARGEKGNGSIYDGAGALVQTRAENGDESGHEGTATLGASTWFGRTLMQMNSQFGLERGEERSISRRVSAGPNIDDEQFAEQSDEFQYEIGLNLQRQLRERLSGKLILLYNREHEERDESQYSRDMAGGITGSRLKQREQVSAEAIARMELDWAVRPDHLVRFNLESASNLLDNSEIETEDDGGGPQPVQVPGANARVEEQRWDALLKDTWTAGALELDYGIGAEVSTLAQTGDAASERDFFFVKPHLLATWSAGPRDQIRLRVAREAVQLDFGDFISASVFEDDELAPGNPDLRPETRWLVELGYEKRYGDTGMAGVTAFHHWINDVQDLLPLTVSEEVAGNIGSGRRWGVLFESVWSLEGFYLPGVRIDINGRWQHSSVTDPVTGRKRVLSVAGDDDEDEAMTGADNEYMLAAGVRQDIDMLRLGWGLEVEIVAESPRFKVNELEIRDEGPQLDAFIETTRWPGLKFRLEANNLLDRPETRERFIYSGLRVSSPLEQHRYERSTDGRELMLSVSGSF